MRIQLALALALLSSAAAAQTTVKQSGNPTPNTVPAWISSGVIGGGVTSGDSPISSFGVTNNGGCGIGVASQRLTAAGRQLLCIGVSDSGGGIISLQNYGTDTAQPLKICVNGTCYTPGGTIAGLQVGTTTVGGSGRQTNGVLYDNAGVLSEYAVSGTGSVALTASPALTGVPTAPTASPGTNTTQLATTAFVQASIAGDCTTLGAFLVGTGSGSQCSTAAGSVATLNGGPLNINTTANSLAQGLNIVQSGAGVSSTPCFVGQALSAFSYNCIRITDAVTTGPNFGLYLEMNATAAGSTGGSAAFFGATVGGSASGATGAPIGATLYSNVTTNYAGGTTLSPLGASYGFSVYGRAIGANMHLNNVTGGEINFEAAGSGTDVNYISGLQIVANDNHAIHGTTYDAVLSLSKKSTAIGANQGILYSAANGGFPVATTGTLLQTMGAATVTAGIDISSVTISGNAFKSPGVTIAGGTGGGNLAINTGINLSDGTVIGELTLSALLTHSFTVGSQTNHPLTFVTNNTLVGSISNAGIWNIGVTGTLTGQMGFSGSGTGTATITAQSAAGSPTLTLPNASGTFAVSATSPITLSATTGAIACATCLIANQPGSFTTLANTDIQTTTISPAANTSGDGHVLNDPTVASSSNQQYSPRIRLTGQGWKTTATAASQQVDWIMENRPVQGTTVPGTNFAMAAQVNGGGYVDHFIMNDPGAGSFAGIFNGNGNTQFALQVSTTTYGTFFVDNTQFIVQSSQPVPLILKANGIEFARGTASQFSLANGTVPTISSGACGTGTNGSVSGSNQTGLVTIGAVATTTCTISFSTTLTAAPSACELTPANATAAATSTTVARVSSISTSAWVITGAVLASANYYYHCI